MIQVAQIGQTAEFYCEKRFTLSNWYVYGGSPPSNVKTFTKTENDTKLHVLKISSVKPYNEGWYFCHTQSYVGVVNLGKQ